MTKPGVNGTRTWRTRVTLGIVAATLGGFLALDVLSTSSAYLASLVFAQSIYIIGLLTIVSLALLAVRRTRRAGVVTFLGAVVLLVSFYGVYLAGYGFGLAAWRNDHPVPLQEIDIR